MLNICKDIGVFLVIIFSCNFSYGQEQKIEVIYAKAYKNFKDTSVEKPKFIEGLEYRLTIEGVKSKFEFIPSMPQDGVDNKRFIGQGGGKGTYYKNVKTKEKIHQKTNPFTKEKFLIIKEFNEIEWILTKEKKMIADFTCFKAIGVKKFKSPLDNSIQERKITVWYTPDIPVPFGPAGFDGLPGLVLEKSSTSFYFVATKISFNPEKIHFPILKPNEGRNVTQEEYENYSRSALKTLEGH